MLKEEPILTDEILFLDYIRIYLRMIGVATNFNHDTLHVLFSTRRTVFPTNPYSLPCLLVKTE